MMRGAGQRLLPIGGHDRCARAAARRRVATPTPVLVDESRSASRVSPGCRRGRTDDDFHLAGFRDAEHSEAESPAEIAEADVALASLAFSETAPRARPRRTRPPGRCRNTSSRLKLSFSSPMTMIGGPSSRSATSHTRRSRPSPRTRGPRGTASPAGRARFPKAQSVGQPVAKSGWSRLGECRLARQDGKRLQ